jgi:hypothetical protein
MELNVPQPAFAIRPRLQRRDHSTKGAWCATVDLVGHGQQDVRRPFGLILGPPGNRNPRRGNKFRKS